MQLSHSWDFQQLMTNELSESESESVTRRIIANLHEYLHEQLTICYQNEWSIFKPEIAQMQPV